jgi:hypothetical protein
MATTGNKVKDTPAQPQITQWGQLGEILGGVKFPWSCYADSHLMTSLSALGCRGQIEALLL